MEKLAIPGKAYLDLSTSRAIYSCNLLPGHPNLTDVELEGDVASQEGGAAFQRAKRQQSMENLVGRKRIKAVPPQQLPGEHQELLSPWQDSV